MHVRKVLMTPELALKLLDANDNNRLFDPVRADWFAAALKDGRFIPESSSPIVVGKNGQLQNGQHRLSGTVRSGISWECVLIEDAPAEAMLYHDTGKARSFGDYLRSQGYRQSSHVASVTRLLWLYDTGALASRFTYFRARSVKSDHGLLWAYYQDHKEEIAQAIHAGRSLSDKGTYRLVTRSVASTTAAILARIDAEDCEAFIAHMSASSEESTPTIIQRTIRALLNLPQAGTGGVPGDQQHQMALLFKGWNNWRQNNDLGYVAWRPGGKRPEDMPVPR